LLLGHREQFVDVEIDNRRGRPRRNARILEQSDDNCFGAVAVERLASLGVLCGVLFHSVPNGFNSSHQMAAPGMSERQNSMPLPRASARKRTQLCRFLTYLAIEIVHIAGELSFRARAQFLRAPLDDDCAGNRHGGGDAERDGGGPTAQPSKYRPLHSRSETCSMERFTPVNSAPHVRNIGMKRAKNTIFAPWRRKTYTPTFNIQSSTCTAFP